MNFIKKIVQISILISVFWSLGTQPGLAQQNKVKVLGLSVEGNKSADANMIRTNSGIKPGMEITGDVLQSAIRQLWSLSLFSDVEIVLDRELAEGIYLTIKVKEYPRLERTELDGNKKLKKDEVEDLLSFYRAQVISPTVIARAHTKLKEKYQEKGYLLAEIDIKTIPAETEGRVIVKINIDEGEKVQIKNINFHGNESFSDKKLRKQMKETKQDTWWRGADFDEEKYREDREKVLSYYRNEGFRDAEILRDSLYYGEKRDDMYIDIWVAEGIRYQFGSIAWEGNEIFDAATLSAELGFKEGDVYSKEKLDKAIYEKVGGLYYDRGYIYAQINPKEIPADKSRVNLQFLVNEGSQALINKIRITGNTKTKEKVIRREMRIFPGDVFSKELLQRSQRDIWMLNYFANVEPKVQPVDQDKVDLEFKVEERSTDTANMSAGWSERDKIIGSIGVTMANLFGNGQRLSFDWNFAKYYQSFEVNFTEPWLMDTPTLAGFGFYDIKRDGGYIWFKQRSRGMSARVGRRFTWPDNYFRGDWIYRIDDSEFTDLSGNSLTGSGFLRFNGLSSSVTQIISRNSLDRPEFPTSGSEVSLTNEIAGTVLGGNVDYHKHIFQSNWFFPSLWKLVLYVNFQMGYMEGFKQNSQIPPLEYFFLGGDGMSQSIALRGYEDPLRYYSEGGKALLKYSVELRVPISPNPTIFGLVFAEAGETWANFRSANPFELRRSVGVGARIFMPMIGILGFDYAYGFDNINATTGAKEGAWKPHFVFGRGF